SVYATINAARERIQRRERRANRLSVDRAHHFLVVHDLPWIAFIDDLAAVDRVQAVRDPGRIGEVRLRDQHRDFHLLDLPDSVDPTARSGKGPLSSGAWPTPSRARRYGGSALMSFPWNVIFPARNGSRPMMLSMVVVLPAPLRPTRTTDSLSPTSSETCRRIC